jgi:hypothetical protein
MTFFRSRILFFIFLLAAASFHVACGDNVTETTVTIYLDADGGTALGPRGSRLVVPQGALEGLTEFTLIQMNEKIVPELLNHERRSIALVAQPEDRTFNKPVTIQMAYNPSDLSVAQQKARLAVYRSREWIGDWERLDGTVSVETNEIRALSSKLGVFAVFLIPSDQVEIPADGDSDAELSACSCNPWLGSLCLVEDEACSDIDTLSFSQPGTEDCATSLAIQNTSGEIIYSLESISCDETINPVFERPEAGDCRLGFIESDSSLQLACGHCVNTFRADACMR